MFIKRKKDLNNNNVFMIINNWFDEKLPESSMNFELHPDMDTADILLKNTAVFTVLVQSPPASQSGLSTTDQRPETSVHKGLQRRTKKRRRAEQQTAGRRPSHSPIKTALLGGWGGQGGAL